MPSTSKKQSSFMAAVAHNPAFAKKVGVSQSVGKDFNTADKGKTFKEGGAMKDMKQDKAMVKKAVGMHDKQMHGGKKTDMGALKKGGMPMVMKDGKKIPAFAAKNGGMADGGMTDPRAKMMMAKLGADRAGRAMPAPTADMRGRAMPRRPMAAETAPAPMMKKGGMTKMAKGGGIESKGKTQGKMVTMKSGGRSC
jgi:hypothetical protein